MSDLYKANFLWPYEEDSLEGLLYDFANAGTEEYRQEIYKEIRSRFEKNRGDT